MAHRQQQEFCESVRQHLPQYFFDIVVVDIGSLDINGSNRDHFTNCLYLGVDLQPGRNVDFACKGHELDLPDASLDVVISTECFEHDQYYALTLRNIVRMIKPGGLLLFTCATTGRPEHGTRRTTPEDAPLTMAFGNWGDYYKNLEESDIRQVLPLNEMFESYTFSTNDETHDLYFWGIKKGVFTKREDYSFLLRRDAANNNEISTLLEQSGEILEQLSSLKLAEQMVADQASIIDQQAARLEIISNSSASKTREITTLKDETAEKDRVILRLEEAVNRTVSDQNSYLDYARRIEKDVSDSAERIANVQYEYRKILESNSWRVTRPLRFAARLARGEFSTAFRSLSPRQQNTRAALLRTIYHKLPLAATSKLKIRERLLPILSAYRAPQNGTTVAQAVMHVIANEFSKNVSNSPARQEGALAGALSHIATSCRQKGRPNRWIILPFLATGGAEAVALNLAHAFLKLDPNDSVLIIVADRDAVGEKIVIPQNVHLMVLDRFFKGPANYEEKQNLFRDLIQACRPKLVHNINSEVAWHTFIRDGDRLKLFTKLFASVFAFQFAPDGTKIGYAAYFLTKALPHLEGIFSDNQRFINDAITEYKLSESASRKLNVLYQPCKLESIDGTSGHNHQSVSARSLQPCKPTEHERPQILWAGRLDAEKRLDLLVAIVRACPFADFRIFGHSVLNDAEALPDLENLFYEGAFASPFEWVSKYRFTALIFTSRWEGLPNVLIEAGFLKISIIAPTVGGVGELITPETGYPLREQPSVDNYIAAIKDIISNPGTADQRRTNLKSLIDARHSWTAFVNLVSSFKNYVDPITEHSLHGVTKQTAQEFSNHEVPKIGERREDLLVSVVVPCFNQGRYLIETVQSILAGSLQCFEIIIIDDGSTDPRTTQYLNEAALLDPHRIRVHRQKNAGLSAARNQGVRLAEGRFIQFLDADDLLAPEKLAVQSCVFDINPAIDVVISNFWLCDEEKNVFSKPEEAIARFNLELNDFLYKWERGFAIPIHCGLFRKSLFDNVAFDITVNAKEDWLFWTTLSLANVSFAYVHCHSAIYRQHATSMRRSYVEMGKAWINASLQIAHMLNGREPLFFESAVGWFNEYYRAHPAYSEEIKCLESAAFGGHSRALDTGAVSDLERKDVRIDAARLVRLFNRENRDGKAPRFSIVIPVHGHYEYLQECLESVASQEFGSFEVICVDDASPDERVTRLMDELQDKSSALQIIILERNVGISNAQNRAVSLASGEFVAFLDCDDALDGNALMRIEQVISEHPDVDYLFTDRTDVDENGRCIRVARYGGYPNIKFNDQDRIKHDLLDGMVASHLKVIRRTAYLQVEGCNEAYAGVQDWDLALKISSFGKMFYVHEALYRHRIHQQSVTKSYSIGQFRKTNAVRRLHGTERFRASIPPDRFENPVIFKNSDLPVELATLKGVWQSGRSCVAEIEGELNLAQLNFLREFNSYFDRISFDDNRTPCSLYGYLWDHRIMQTIHSTVVDDAKTLQPVL